MRRIIERGIKLDRLDISLTAGKGFFLRINAVFRGRQGVAMPHNEEQHRASAGLLILLIVAQALLLLRFNVLCIAHL